MTQLNGRGKGWRRQPLLERFWAKVDRSAGPDACWPWTGGKARKRGGFQYGIIREDAPSRRMILAHRIALATVDGEMREDREACHRCGHTLCCNPDHLYWGTHWENMQDVIKANGGLGKRKAP